MSDGADFTWDDLKKYRTAKPFRPFFFEFKSGDVVEVLDALAFGGVEDRLAVAHPRHGLRYYRVSGLKGVRLMDAREMAERHELIARMKRRA